MQLSELLNNTTTVNSTTIEDIEREYEYDEKHFKEFHEIKLDESITHPDRYQNSWKQLSKDKNIIALLKYIKGSISFKAVIEF